jgi:hypothetical protein
MLIFGMLGSISEELDNYERTLGESDKTFRNLLAIIEEQGYGISDSMYYTKLIGARQAGMDLIMSDGNVEEILELYAEKKVTITMMRGSKPDLLSFPDINKGDDCEPQVPIFEIGVPIVYEINDDGVMFPSQGSSQAEPCDCNPMQLDDSSRISRHSTELQFAEGEREGNCHRQWQ